ncbi:S24/S26 family peptidase [Lachnospiraceae bacterium OttesenSCG-928-D06]|nr:S24/S26 family peptidase [Lachnospiraceae bacterium OttesenSCG-928-D06]
MTDNNVTAEELFTLVKEQLDNGLVSFAVAGMSMWPLLAQHRDFVTVEKCTAKQIKNMDIILYQTPQKKYLLHRVVRLTDTTFTTLGDGCLVLDEPQLRETVFARVVSVKRKGKILFNNAWYFKILFYIWTFLLPIRGPLLRFIRPMSH